jgi:hypothetical protein
VPTKRHPGASSLSFFQLKWAHRLPILESFQGMALSGLHLLASNITFI